MFFDIFSDFFSFSWISLSYPACNLIDLPLKTNIYLGQTPTKAKGYPLDISLVSFIMLRNRQTFSWRYNNE